MSVVLPEVKALQQKVRKFCHWPCLGTAEVWATLHRWIL